MAEQTLSVECRIADIKPIPNTAKQIVSVEFTLGERKWFKAFRLEYDRTISMEEFKRELVASAYSRRTRRTSWLT